MKKIILVAGDLAALKSTISKSLSRDLKLICLNKDLIKEVLGHVIGFKNREENLKLSEATFELMLSLSKNILSTYDAVILESNFKDFEMEKVNQFAKDHQFLIDSIFLSGDFKVLYERYVSRQKERDIVHQSTGLMSYETFLSSKRTYDLKLYGNNSLYVDTTFFDDSKYQIILQYVKDNLSK